MTEQISPMVEAPVRLHKAALVLQLLTEHPEVAAAPIDWTINDHDAYLWATTAYGNPESEAAAQVLAAALGVAVCVREVRDGCLYGVDGRWAGVRVSFHAFGPESAAAGVVAA
ncbi:hypothetical protein [Streptomyces ossamyceticus]|uniref:hypothetical protein n=1 Tax=Streptomyces ossamyceticus TaxID=249581 RepID=UPI0006E37A93|nr:hypothetical protein [Streptomyces ossamyceticus]